MILDITFIRACTRNGLRQMHVKLWPRRPGSGSQRGSAILMEKQSFSCIHSFPAIVYSAVQITELVWVVVELSSRISLWKGKRE